MRKIQSFYILKLTTDRLKETNYKLNITLEQGRRNNEVIALSDSELVRTILRLKNSRFSQVFIDDLLKQKKILTRKKNNEVRLKQVLQEIDQMLFLPEIISIKISDKRHYEKIIKRGGVEVNGLLYVPFIFSAGLIRRNTGLFVEQSLKIKLQTIFDNNRNLDIPVTPAKYNSYLGLYSSSTLAVSTPRIAVVPDLLLKRIKKVDYGTYRGIGVDPLVEERETELEFNAFDGCGLISPKQAKRWSQELELDDYVASTFGVRSAWLKGMLAVFDFHDFSKSVANTNIITDYYGNPVNIDLIDVLVSPSMFKLADSYANTQTYLDACTLNELGWGVSKVNPKEEKSFCKTSYQFLQVLKLDDKQIEKLCEPTVKWFSDSSGLNVESSLLYAIGEMGDFQKGWFDKLQPIHQALFLENSLVQDRYFVKTFDKTFAKRKHDSKKGNLILNGNYQAVIPDLYLYACHIFGLELKPVLQDTEAYSKYWLDRNVTRVAGVRSPIVYESELVELNFKTDPIIAHWFKHIQSGIVLPANGESLVYLLAGGMDVDYDLLATINSPEMLIGRQGGNPVVYDTAKAPKHIINQNSDDLLYDAQLRGIGTKVGLYTNVASSLYTLLSNFDSESLEYNTIKQRLKWSRACQGLEIDRQKGLVIPPFPEHWTKYKKISDDMTDEEKQMGLFNNSILVEQRPYFFIYLYDTYMRKYRHEKKLYDNIALTRFGLTFDELRNLPEKTKEQQDVINRYNRKTYFIENDSVMNRISYHMQFALADMQKRKTQKNLNFDHRLLYSNEYRKPSQINVDKFKLLYREYKSLKRNFQNGYSEYEDVDYSTVEQMYTYINQKTYNTITTSRNELVDLAVYVCYNELGVQSLSFLWNCYGSELVENLKDKHAKKFIRVLMPSKTGTIDYLWKKYGWYMIGLEQ